MTTSVFPVPVVASGGMTLIASVTTALNGTTASITSIPQTYKELKLQIFFTGSVGGPSQTTLTFNGSTLGYSWGHPYYYASSGTGSVTTGGFSYGYNQAALILPGITSGSTWVTIPDYTSSVVAKNFQYFDHTGYIQTTVNNGAGQWSASPQAGITSMNFSFANVSGTTYTVKLWGVN
jgi:hypothetical protein